MPKFSEETLSNWTKPPSDTEESKLSNSERLVREAIKEDPKLSRIGTETFGQGSYANNTNVRLNSDIDINVRYTDAFYFDLPPGTKREEFSLTNPASYSFEEYKNDVEKALINKFGRSAVIRDDKCLKVLANTSRIETDVVPTWNHRRYATSGSYVLGARLKSDTGKYITNYPLQHIANGKDKNGITSRRFKRLTRIHRKLRYRMIEDGEPVSDSITSFLLECLIWNFPNEKITGPSNWQDRLKTSIAYLYECTANEERSEEWGEVSELLYLFRGSRKWTKSDVSNYMAIAWRYLEY